MNDAILRKAARLAAGLEGSQSGTDAVEVARELVYVSYREQRRLFPWVEAGRWCEVFGADLAGLEVRYQAELVRAWVASDAVPSAEHEAQAAARVPSCVCGFAGTPSAAPGGHHATWCAARLLVCASCGGRTFDQVDQVRRCRRCTALTVEGALETFAPEVL